MKTSDQIGKIAESLVKAQRVIEAGVLVNAENASYGSKYADLGAVLRAVKGPLLTEGIIIIQSPTIGVDPATSRDCVFLTTRLVHQSGEWIEDTAMSPLAQRDSQGFGTAVSYMRRYTLAPMMGLYQGDDDDGEGCKLEGIPIKDARGRNIATDKPAAAATGDSKPAAAATGDSTPAVATTGEFTPAATATGDSKPAAATEAATTEAAAALSAEAAEAAEAKAAKEARKVTALNKRFSQWKTLIAGADISRLTTAKNTAANIFADKMLADILALITEREKVLQAIPA